MERSEQVSNVETTNITVLSTSSKTEVGGTSQSNMASTDNYAVDIINSLKPVMKAFAAAVSKVEGKDISQIAGVVWDEFKEMTPFQKMLAIIGTTLIVGVVGYFSWKVVRGNWELIKQCGEEVLKKSKDKVVEMVDNMDMTAVLKKAYDMFDKRQVSATLPGADIRSILQQMNRTGCGNIVAALTTTLINQGKGAVTK